MRMNKKEYSNIKKGLIRDIFRMVEKNPNAVELTNGNDAVFLKDIFDENKDVKQKYKSWLDRKIVSSLSAREILNDNDK